MYSNLSCLFTLNALLDRFFTAECGQRKPRRFTSPRRPPVVSPGVYDGRNGVSLTQDIFNVDLDSWTNMVTIF